MNSSAPSAGFTSPPIRLLQNEETVCEVLSLQDKGGLDFCYRRGFSPPLSSGRELYILTAVPPVSPHASSPVLAFAGDQKKWALNIGMVHYVAGAFWSKVTFLHEVLGH